jgi:hypothetical protein
MRIHGLAVVGVQETRSSSSGTSTLHSKHGKLIVATSDRNPAGMYGCALWIDGGVQWHDGPSRSGILEDDVAVLSADPRWLIVKMHVPFDVAVFVVAHGPHKGTSRRGLPKSTDMSSGRPSHPSNLTPMALPSWPTPTASTRRGLTLKDGTQNASCTSWTTSASRNLRTPMTATSVLQ